MSEVKTTDASGGVPAGWKLVPVEPTSEMLDAGYKAYAAAEWDLGRARRGPERESLPILARAMIASAPPAPTLDAGSDLAKLSAEALPGPWTYRPLKYDDWGVIRGPHNGEFEPIVAVSSGDFSATLAAHREMGTDPYEKTGRFIAALVNAYRSGRLVEASSSRPAWDFAEPDFCTACAVPLVPGEMVMSDVSGGLIHVSCCGPEREGYVGADNEPLKPGEPIPTGWRYEASASPPPGEDLAGQGESTAAEKAYGILWRIYGAGYGYAHDARTLLRDALNEPARRRGIAWANEKYGQLGPDPALMLNREERAELGRPVPEIRPED